MKNSDDNLVKIAELLFGSIEGNLSPEQFAELEQLLAGDSSAMDDYIDLVNLSCSLSGPEAMVVLRKMCSSGKMDKQLWQALETMEEDSPVAEIEIPQQPLATPEVITTKSYWQIKSAIAAAVIIFFIVRMLMPTFSPAASITDQYKASWQGSGNEYNAGQKLYPGNYFLSEGYAELTFNDGSVAIVQAPTDLNIESSSRLTLHSGKVCVLVSNKEKGFCVHTDKGDIIDLGTEFGVSADNAGNISAHVFQGKVIFDSAKAKLEPVVLEANHYVSIDNSWEVSQGYSSDTFAFVRDMETIGKWQKYFAVNLISNPGFEENTAGSYSPDVSYDRQITNVSIADWVDEGPATVYSYIHPAEEGFPQADANVLPSDRGKNFYVGVDSGDVYQDISLKELAAAIDGKGLAYKFSGWIGGYEDHEDTLEIIAVFSDISGQELSQVSLGPVLPEQRNSKSDFVYCELYGDVPAGSNGVRIILRAKRNEGVSDSYADNLEFVLSER